MDRQAYHTDLTDVEWMIFEATFSQIRRSTKGRKPSTPRREVVNAILYRLRTGCHWRNLPHDFPRWGLVYRTYRRWILAGYWEQLHDALCREVRKNGRDPEPSALIIDSQSVKADAWAAGTGYTAGKKVKGVKRHVVVDVLGLLIGVVVHAASVQDRDGAKLLALRIKDRLPRVKLVWADGGNRGQLIEWFKYETGWTLEIVKRDDDLSTFKVLPKRWIVERTFGWLMFWRVLNHHHKRKHITAENIMRIVMTRNMLRYLAREEPGTIESF